jgi:hypothetical protein
VAGGLMLCLPAMQKAAGTDDPAAMDPEMRAQLEAQQQMMADPMGALSRMFSGGGGGGGAGGGEEGEGERPRVAAGPAGGGGGRGGARQRGVASGPR